MPRLLVALAVTTTALSTGVVLATPAVAATCDGTGTTWTGAGDGTTWTDAANWSAGVPTDNGSATISSTATITAVAGTVCGLTLQAPGGGLSLTGALTLTGDAALSGPLTWTGLLTSEQSLVLQAGTDLTLGDATVVVVDGESVLGAGTALHAAPGTTTPPVLRVYGSAAAGGNVTLTDVGLDLAQRQSGAGLLNLGGSTVSVSGVATTTLEAGAAVTSTQNGGTLEAGAGSSLVVATGAEVQLPAVLRLAGATFGGGGTASTLGGNGTLDWQSGTLAGDLTLALPTTVDGAGTRVVPAGSTLTNANQLNVTTGGLDLKGTLVNGGGIQVRPGTSLTGTAGNPSALSNLAGATLRVEPVGSGGSAVLDGVHLSNAGTLSIPSKETLILGSSGAQTTSDLLDGGTISSPSAPLTSSDPQGTLQVAQGSSLRLGGQTTLDKTTLLLDDPIGDGATARLEAASVVATLTAAEQGAGAFAWHSGTVVGAVTIDKLTTDITSTGANGRRLLTGLDGSHPGLLTLGGAATLNPTTVLLDTDATVKVTGTLTLASSPGGFAPLDALSGQQLVVATGGTLRHVAQSTTPNGSSNSTGPMVVSVPLVNNGTMLLDTSLTVPAGYTQAVAAGAPASADPPGTGVFGSAVLSGSNGVDAVAPFAFQAGGLAGTGTIEGAVTTVAGFVHPGLSTTSGTLTIKGSLSLGSGTDLQIVLRSATDHDKLVVLPLTVGSTVLPGSAALQGSIAGLSAVPTGGSSAYNPAYGTVVTDVLTATSRSGAFTSATSSGLSNGYGWRPQYPAPVAGQPVKVNLFVTDTAPPAIGIAGNPAFTTLTSQRFTYSAVDNKTGVDVFDVRWRQATPSSAFGAWQYPATWRHTRLTSQTLNGLVAGRTYCFSVRAADKAHNISDWSQPLCTARLLDDRQLSASAGWYRPGGKTGYYTGTYSESSRLGATLRVNGTYTRVAVTARKCRGCGSLLIYSGATRIGSLALNSATTGIASWVSPVLTSRTAVVTLKVATSGHPVAVDGVGLAR